MARLRRDTLRFSMRGCVGSGPAIVNDTGAAADLLAEGRNVVLVIDPDAAEVVLPGDGAGRLAVLVGRLADQEVRAAAEQMARELFPAG
jgi:hypothetical protein